MTTFMTATQARKNFYSLIDMAKKPGNSVMITHNGLPEVIVMSSDEYADFDVWQTMREIDEDLELQQDLLDALTTMKAGKPLEHTISLEDLRKDLGLAV